MKRRTATDLSRNKATNVSHVTEQQSATLISNGPEPGVIPIPGVSASTADNQLRPEIQGLLLEAIVINVAGGGANLIGQALEVNGSGGDLLATRGVVAVGEVATGGQVEAHDAVVGVEESGVGSEVGRGAGVGLNVDAPLGGVAVEGLHGAGAAEVLDLVDVLIATVVAVAGHALGVLVSEGAAEGLDDGEGGEVLGGDQLDPPALPPLFLLDQVMDLRIHSVEAGVPPF